MKLLALLLLVLPLAAQARSPSIAAEAPERRSQSVEHWTEQLAAADFRDRWYAAYMLGTLGPKAVSAVHALHEAIMKVRDNKYDNEYVRGTAAWALGQIGPAAESEISLLSGTMHSRGHLALRRASVEALGKVGAAAKGVIPELVKLLGDDDAVTRVNTAVALWKIDHHPKALPALVAMLRRGEAPEPYLAAVAVGQMEADATTVAPALVAALHASDGDVRRAASRSLGHLGETAFPALREAKAFEDADPETRRLVIEAVGSMGTVAVAPLTAALKDKSPAVRRAAARALGKLGSEARSALAELETAVNDTDDDVRRAANKARRNIRSE